MNKNERDEVPFITAIIIGIINYLAMIYIIANAVFGMDEKFSIIAIISIIIPVLFLRDIIGHL